MKTEEKLHKSIKKQLELTFAQLICDITEKEKAYTFLSDFLTEEELDVLSKRLAVAYWLKKRRSYENIKKNLKVSASIISQIQSQMGTKGIQYALKLLEAEEWANVWSERIKKITNKSK